jgi:hypothetical protein
MNIEFGNVKELNTNDTGWFIGFSDWTKANIKGVTDLRYVPKNSLAHTIHVKWMQHSVNDLPSAAKPPSEGRSISILVSEKGKYHMEFSSDDKFSKTKTVKHTLKEHGDFVIWGEDIYHRSSVKEDCIVLTIRWIPIQPSN